MKKHNLLGIILAIAMGCSLVLMHISNAFFPNLILPKPNAIWIILLSLIALVIDHYASKEAKHDFRFIPIYGAVIFGIFPLAALVTSPIEALKYAFLGAAILTALAYIYDSIIERLSSGPIARLAPVVSAFGLYLAAQCLMGII